MNRRTVASSLRLGGALETCFIIQAESARFETPLCGPRAFEMFLWRGRQAILVLALIVFYCALLVHPAWRPTYARVAPFVFIILALGALRHALRKQ